MKIESLEIPDVRLITPKVFGDARGYFFETWRENALQEAGIDVHFVQDNQAMSGPPGTVRGLHFQLSPKAQDKLVRVIRGAILDVAVDLRAGSPTFGRHVARRLSAQDHTQLFVPKGFAHGYCTLEPDTEVVYKVTDYYAPQLDRGIAWDDPALAIAWPVLNGEAILSDKDRRQPKLADIAPPFP